MSELRVSIPGKAGALTVTPDDLGELLATLDDGTHDGLSYQERAEYILGDLAERVGLFGDYS